MTGLYSSTRRTITHLRRYRHIMAVLMKYGFEEVAGILARRLKIGLGSKGLPTTASQSLAQTSLAQRIRMAMEELGPTFIKLGQLLSTRPDLLPVEYIEELEHLQDQVTPEKIEVIRLQIQHQLKASPEELFASFSPNSIAAASIAQVHRACTKDGQEVVLKIRRPHIVKTMHTELEILEDLAGLVKKRRLFPETINPVKMVQEFSQAVAKEADLANERRNQQRFIRNFADDPTVHVPRVFTEYSSEGLLTMEYIDGIKPNQIDKLKEAGLDTKEIARRGADFVLKQVFEFGFFHTDPHPGNFLVMADNVLAPLDFGQVGRRTQRDRMLLQYLVLAIVNGDADKIVNGLERAEVLEDETDTVELTRDLEELLSSYANLPIKDIPFREALSRVFDIIRLHHIAPPRDFTLMLKCLMTIESFAMALDSEFQIIENLKPYARRFSMEEVSPTRLFRQMRTVARGAGSLATRLPEDASAILTKFRRGKFKVHIHHEHLEELEQTLDNSSNRISFSVIIAALLVGSSLLVAQDGTVLGLITLEALGIVGYLTATAIGIWLVISIIRSRKY